MAISSREGRTALTVKQICEAIRTEDYNDDDIAKIMAACARRTQGQALIEAGFQIMAQEA
jgi:hypothetical protein